MDSDARLDLHEALALEVIDVHAEGEPGRVVLADGLGIEGETMAQRLAWCERHLDRLRTLLLREPRGYPALCGVFVTPPVTPGADAGIIVLEQAGFRPMSGSNTMCAVTALLETGVLARREPQTLVRLDTAAGPVEAVARVSGGEVTSVQVRNVPSFVVGLDLPVDVLGIGTVSADIAFGGQFYVQAPAAALGVELGAANAPAIARAAMGLLASAREQHAVRHPTEPDIDEIALVMLTGPADQAGPSTPAIPLCCPAARSMRATTRRGAAPSIGLRAAPEPVRAWPVCTPAGSFVSGRNSFTRARSARPSPACCTRNSSSAATPRCCRRSRGARGSPGRPGSGSIPATPFPRDTPSPTCGRRPTSGPASAAETAQARCRR